KAVHDHHGAHRVIAAPADDAGAADAVHLRRHGHRLSWGDGSIKQPAAKNPTAHDQRYQSREKPHLASAACLVQARELSVMPVPERSPVWAIAESHAHS